MIAIELSEIQGDEALEICDQKIAESISLDSVKNKIDELVADYLKSISDQVKDYIRDQFKEYGWVEV